MFYGFETQSARVHLLFPGNTEILQTGQFVRTMLDLWGIFLVLDRVGCAALIYSRLFPPVSLGHPRIVRCAIMCSIIIMMD